MIRIQYYEQIPKNFIATKAYPKRYPHVPLPQLLRTIAGGRGALAAAACVWRLWLTVQHPKDLSHRCAHHAFTNAVVTHSAAAQMHGNAISDIVPNQKGCIDWVYGLGRGALSCLVV